MFTAAKDLDNGFSFLFLLRMVNSSRLEWIFGRCRVLGSDFKTRQELVQLNKV